MPSANEASGAQSQIEATLDQGVAQLSQAEKVEFRRYTKVALAQDGFVFWVATDEVMTATGSLHYATDRIQDVDQTIGTNQVLLTSEVEISQFNLVEPTSMWIGSWPLASDGPPLQVAFSQRGNYFQQANVWHYSGFAVYPVLRTQIIESAADLPAGPIVSNSLPIWLTQNALAPVYPSWLVPDNAAPPYIACDIQGTESLSAAPLIGPWPGTVEPGTGASPLHTLSVSQCSRDTVTFTLYGFDNQRAWQFLIGLYEASVDGTAPFGFANTPIPMDDKRPQVEIAALAQKKTIVVVANYDQAAANVVARRLILEASISSVTYLGGRGVTGRGMGTQAAQVGSGEESVFE